MIEEKIKSIINARKNNILIPDLEDNMPSDVEEAYILQEEVVKNLKLNSLGWKVGCTTEMAQNFSGMREPFSGVMFSETTYKSPKLALSLYVNKPIIEPEICFEIKEDIVDVGELYNAINIKRYIKAIFPVIEIVDARYEKGWEIKALETIIDNGVHTCLVKGERLSNWESYDRLNSEITLFVDNKLICSGRGSNVLNDPLNSISWLANKLIQKGKFIKSGEIITTGNTLDKPIFAEKNTIISAKFKTLGEVTMRYN